MRSDEITLLVPVKDPELASELTKAGIHYETPARDGMAFDSGAMYAYIDLALSSYPLASVLIAFIKRNDKKRFIVKDGKEVIDASGCSAKEFEKILKTWKGSQIEIRDESE